MQTFPPGLTALPVGMRPGGRFDSWRPHRPRYVVLDVDGTLIGITGTATPAVVTAAAACASADLAVGLATGRMPSACAALAAQVGLTGPHVVHNGAEVRASDRSLRTWPLEPGTAEKLLTICRRRSLYVELYAGVDFWASDARRPARPHWELLGRRPRGSIEECDLDTVLKASVLLFPGDDLDRLLADLHAVGLTAGPAHAPAMPEVTFVNVTAKGSDKGAALAVAASHVGCTLAEVVAVGDGLNDLSMLEVAGTAIAMGQALPEVRAAAHLIVPEIDADGVAHALDAALDWRLHPY